MGRAMQMITGFVTAPSTTITAVTPGAGDSLQVANGAVGSDIRLINMWGDWQTAGILRVKSPLFHDNVNGIQMAGVASEVYPLMEDANGQKLEPNDLMQMGISGSGTAGDIESASLLVYYDDLMGSAANLKTWQEVYPRIESYMTVQNTLSLGTAGGYSGSQVITTTDNQWKALRDYALLGYLVTVECCSVGWTGPDTSNRRIGGPGHETNKTLTRNWFVNLSQTTGKPCIPIFNASNVGATTIDGVQDENGADSQVTSIFALLK
jgi:hypothetical protein